MHWAGVGGNCWGLLSWFGLDEGREAPSITSALNAYWNPHDKREDAEMCVDVTEAAIFLLTWKSRQDSSWHAAA
jgi:hypothetical protein